MWTWLPTALDFVSSLVWPAVAVMAVVMFRRPISAFVSEVIEVSGLGVSAKRGDLQAARIRNSIESTPLNQVEGAITELPGEDTEAALLPAISAVHFLGSVSRYRLQELVKESESISGSGEARLLVIWSYQELVVFIRGLELAEQAGSDQVEVPRYHGNYTYRSLASIGGPTTLSDALVELQDFKQRVDDRTETVSSQGARTYISTAIEVLDRIRSWYTKEESIRLVVGSAEPLGPE
jgi:hypothetical protein